MIHIICPRLESNIGMLMCTDTESISSLRLSEVKIKVHQSFHFLAEADCMEALTRHPESEITGDSLVNLISQIFVTLCILRYDHIQYICLFGYFETPYSKQRTCTIQIMHEQTRKSKKSYSAFFNAKDNQST